MIAGNGWLKCSLAIGSIILFAPAAGACLSASLMTHLILPSVPPKVPDGAIVLKVLLKSQPDWWEVEHDYIQMPVLSVARGQYRKPTIDLPLRPVHSCEMIGLVGEPGYVVAVQSKRVGWWPIRYRLTDDGRPYFIDQSVP